MVITAVVINDKNIEIMQPVINVQEFCKSMGTLHSDEEIIYVLFV